MPAVKTWFDPPLIATFPPCTLPAVLSGRNLSSAPVPGCPGTSINDVINSLKTLHPQDPGGHAASTPARSLDPLGSNFLAEAKGWYEVDHKKKKAGVSQFGQLCGFSLGVP